MPHGLLPFIVRRTLLAAVMVVVVSSAALLLIRFAPGDHLSGFEIDPRSAAAERARLGLDRPFLVQYASWFARAIQFDFGESLKYRRPVQDLLGERVWNTLLLGISALAVATVIGIPGGVLTGSTDGGPAWLARGVSFVLVSVPPLVTSFVLLLIAARTRVFPVGGLGAVDSTGPADTVRYLVMPCLALALPIAAVIERLQSESMREALQDPSVRSARARGLPASRLIWRHAFRLSLKPVVALYGVLVGTVLSGSFVVEIVMSWPGLGALMYEALIARDLYLVAGCAAVGAVFLAAGLLMADIALAVVDPRIRERA